MASPRRWVEAIGWVGIGMAAMIVLQLVAEAAARVWAARR